MSNFFADAEGFRRAAHDLFYGCPHSARVQIPDPMGKEYLSRKLSAERETDRFSRIPSPGPPGPLPESSQNDFNRLDPK